MPRFTDYERDILFTRLRSAGELLFIKHGLKKVTVNDIVQKVGIGKGTFYHFYSSKEHLFMDIYNHAQEEIFIGVEQLLKVEKTSKEKAIEIISYLIKKFREHPLVSMVSGDTYLLLQCKVPKDCLKQNDMDDFALIQKAADAGITFRYPLNVVNKIVQSVFITAHTFSEDEDGAEVIPVLIQAIVNQVVE